jgi:hypothetical protein
MAMMKLKVGLKENADKMKSLADQILADNADFVQLFQGRNFVGLAKLLRERGVMLTTPAYEKISGKESAEFWQNAWGENVTPEIQVTSILLSDALGTQTIHICVGDPMKEMKPDTVTYDAVAIVTWEFHLVSREKGSTGHNATVAVVGTYLHKTGCPWG